MRSCFSRLADDVHHEDDEFNRAHAEHLTHERSVRQAGDGLKFLIGAAGACLTVDLHLV